MKSTEQFDHIVARADELRAEAAAPNSIMPAAAWIEMAEAALAAFSDTFYSRAEADDA